MRPDRAGGGARARFGRGFLAARYFRLRSGTGFPYAQIGVKRLIGFLWFSALAGVMPVACVYDADDRCGPRQTSIDNDRCVCDAGLVPGPSGCEPCPENEEELNGACVCVDGYARQSDAGACEPIPATLGVECDTEQEPCDEPYPVCHVTSGTSGYCTASCTDDEDCEGGYRCHRDGDEGYCRRPPLGYGQKCESDDDCAEGEATYCEILQSHQCLVPCEAGKTDVCFEGEVCCDYVVFQPICVPADACAERGTVLE